MEEVVFDGGVKTYRLNGKGFLRFNPCDPNVHIRFAEGVEKLRNAENEMVEERKKLPVTDGAGMLRLLNRTDKEMKRVLSWIFGRDNNFDALLAGVPLPAVADNGQRLIVNLLEALQPILEDGARQYAREVIDSAQQKAKLRRGDGQ